MSEVECRLKPEPAECSCGCGLVGQPRAKAWADGLGPHVRGCGCRRCKGGRTRGTSRRRENRIARDTGGTREPLSGALSGVDVRTGNYIIEETANLTVCRGLRRWWNTKTVQRKVARLYGRQYGEWPVLILTDEKPWLVVLTFDTWKETLQ